MLKASEQKINFTLPEVAFGNNDEVTVTGASLKPGVIYLLE